MAELKYKRVLLKLSGEALAGEKQIGIDPHTVSKICAEIADVVDMGLEVALVIGGGIAGIQTALDIAEAGFEVDIVEKQPTIGGKMTQIDKTFPTLDCAACILTPKMVDCAQNEKIHIYAYSEVEQVGGFVGNFHTVGKREKRIRSHNSAIQVEIE